MGRERGGAGAGDFDTNCKIINNYRQDTFTEGNEYQEEPKPRYKESSSSTFTSLKSRAPALKNSSYIAYCI
jgi:hypothetical protein